MIAREKLNWLLGPKEGAKEFGEIGLLQVCAVYAFVAAMVTLLAWLR